MCQQSERERGRNLYAQRQDGSGTSQTTRADRKNMNDVKTKQGGFSLVEVVIAIMVLSFGLLAMAASTGYVASQLRSSVFDTQRNLARQRIVEQLRATVFT